MHPTRSTLYLLAATLCWGLSIPLSKMLLPSMSPFWLIALQLFGSLAFLLILAGIQRLRFWRVTPRQLALTLLIGMLEPGLAYGLGFVGMTQTSAVHAAILFSVEPFAILWINIACFAFPRDRRLMLVGALSILGLAVIAVGDSGLNQRASLIGDGMILLGVLCAALYVSLSTHFIHSDSVTGMLIFQQTGSLLFALLVLGLSSFAPEASSFPAPHVLIAAMGVGVIQFALPFLFYFKGARGNGSYWSVFVLNLTPVIGIAASVALLAERLTLYTLVGGAITIGAAAYIHAKSGEAVEAAER